MTGKFRVPSEEYHRSFEGVSKGDLDAVHKSIAHYVERKANPPEPTPALVIGAALHCLVLEPFDYGSRYVVAPDCDRRSAAGKERWSEFSLLSEGKTILPPADAELVDAMADAVLSHPTASKLLTSGEAEQTYRWIDPRTGVLCKCRPDYVRPGIVDPNKKLLLDLKTTTDASYKAFQRSIASYRYHVQGAFYGDGVAEIEDSQVEGFILIAVEKSPPYAVAVYNLDELALDAGRDAYADDLDRVKLYQTNPDNWTGYPSEIQEMHLPSWA